MHNVSDLAHRLASANVGWDELQ